MSIEKRALAIFASVLAVFAVVLGSVTLANAAAGQVPAHSKSAKDNGDGTYTLSLSVTGDSETSEDIQGKVNVVVVYDTSSSMTSQVQGGGATRADQAEDVVYNFVHDLFGFQSKTDSSNIQVGLVRFAVTGSVQEDWTSDEPTITQHFDEGGSDNQTKQNYSSGANGTNWESALSAANALLATADSDPTFVILITDGAPTASGSGNNAISPTGASLAQLTPFYRAALENARSIQTRANTTLFGIYAYGTEADLLDDLMYYANNGTERTIATATETTENYYNTKDTTALNAAIDSIFSKIKEAIGIEQATITDGTTNQVATSTGIAELLEVDTSSFKYYKGGAEWAEAPAATFENGAVKWDLTSADVLENGVEYTVTFKVYPSQTTLDIIADIKNDPGESGAWSKLDPEIQKYINSEGKLSTNTTASLSYFDSRTGQKGETAYVNPEPVATSAVELLSVAKEWENDLDSKGTQPVTLNVTRDGVNTYTVELSEENSWKDDVYVSIGIMGADGKPLAGSEGHDFTFTEPDDLSYHWELDVPVVHPMMIDGELTMLILKQDGTAYNNPNGTTEYTINGKTYYVGDADEVALTATNYRRSNLDFTKVVTGDGANPFQTFPFTFNVVNSNAANGTDGDPNTDAYVWISVRDSDGNPVTDAVVSGATAEAYADGTPKGNGWYYAKSGTDVVINVMAGYKIRVSNLPSGSTYTITEGTLPSEYTFVSSELSGAETEDFTGGQTTTGTISAANNNFQVTYTNKYAPGPEPDIKRIDITVTKVWDDANNKDGIRPKSVKVELMAAMPGREPAFTGQTLTLSEENGWKGTFTGLQADIDGTELTYTVEEVAVEGYEASYSGDAAKGITVTNTHKVEPDKTPGNTPKTPDKPAETPKTGDMTPIVAIEAMAGFASALLAGGFILRRRDEK